MAKITRAHKVCDQQLHVLQERVAELEAKLAALDWTPITESNLPKVGDEVLQIKINGKQNLGKMTLEIVADDWDSGWLQNVVVYAQFRRPINPPVQP